MRRRWLYILFATITLTSGTQSAFSEDILFILSVNTSGFQEIVRSVNDSCRATSKVVVLNDNSEADIEQLTKSSRPVAVVALGDKAYKKATDTLQRTPVLGVMVADQNKSSVSYLAPPEMFLAAMKKSGRKVVTVIYGRKTASYVKRAAELAKNYGITLVKNEATSPVDAIERFSVAKTQSDALWLLPDVTVLTGASAQILLRSAEEVNMPVFTFSRNYLQSGATYAIEADFQLAGKVVGENVCALISGENPVQNQKSYPFREYVNKVVALRQNVPQLVN